VPRLVVIILMILLAGCGPQATPFPADIPVAATSTSEAGAQAPIRYALAANTEGFVSDLALIQAATRVEQLSEPINPDDLGSRYDIVAAYGDLPDGTRSPISPHAALVMQTDSLPLGNTVLLDVFRRSIQLQGIVTTLNIPGITPDPVESGQSGSLRTELANAGWPDGFALNLAYAYVPGVQQLAEQFEAAGIRVRVTALDRSDVMMALEQNRMQAALISWSSTDDRALWTERFGDDHVIDLYTIPISYRATAGLNISFTPDGWPLVSR
jgi:hypothetical protein